MAGAPTGSADGRACGRPVSCVERADADPESEKVEAYGRILAARNSIKIVIRQHGSVIAH